MGNDRIEDPTARFRRGYHSTCESGHRPFIYTTLLSQSPQNIDIQVPNHAVNCHRTLIFKCLALLSQLSQNIDIQANKLLSQLSDSVPASCVDV